MPIPASQRKLNTLYLHKLEYSLDLDFRFSFLYLIVGKCTVAVIEASCDIIDILFHFHKARYRKAVRIGVACLNERFPVSQ